MRYPTFLLYAFTASLLVGCTTSASIKTTDVNVASSRQDRYISTTWITQYRAEVTNHIIGYVRSQYPTIPPGLPKLEVGSVVISNDVHDFNRAEVKEVEPVLRALLQDVSDKVLNPSGNDALLLDVEITFLTPEMSEAENVAAFVALTPLCWGTLFVACPGKVTNYVSIDATVNKNGQALGNVRGIGGATQFVSSVLVGDASDPKVNGTLDSNTKALAAAVADLGGKLKPYLFKAQHPSRSL